MSLFSSIFGSGEDSRGRYPKALIDAAIERAVDGTDSRLRLLSGYRKRLHDPVLEAVDHAIALVDDLPAPLLAKRSQYRDEPVLAAVFASAESMLEDLGRDMALRNFLAGPGRYAREVTALLVAERQEKHILGRELVNGMARRDVAQVAVNFAGYRLAGPAETEEDARRLLKHWMFDQVLVLALDRVAEAQTERSDLTRQRDLLRGKLAALEHGGHGLDAPYPDSRAVRADLERTTEQLHALGAEDRVLEQHLSLVAEVLADARRQLWSRDISLYLDAMNIQRPARDPRARRIILRELHDGKGRCVILVLLSLAVKDLPPREDFLIAAERSLSWKSR